MVAVAVAVPCGNVSAAAFVNLTGSVANAAGVESADAGIHIVAHAVFVDVSSTAAAALAEGVKVEA